MREVARANEEDRPDDQRLVALSDARRLTSDVLFLAAATVLGAWLRLRELAVPSFWFDEIYHYKLTTAAARQTWWRWLTIFEPENGPLFYATQLLGRLSHSPEFSARIAPALCGIAAIPVVWFAARAITGARAVAYASTLLIAVSPLAVYYSREARPYALVVLLAAALTLALLRSNLAAFVALLVVSFYSGAMIAPVIVSVAVAAAFVKWRKPAWWISALACAALIAICYHAGSYPSQMPVSAASLRDVVESFSVVAVDTARMHRTAWIFLGLAIAGAVALIRTGAAGIAVTSIAVLPVAIGLAATWLLHRPFGVRYVIGGLPGYLLLAGAGIALAASLLPRLDFVAALLIAALLAREGWDAAMDEPFQKLGWRTVARTIARHAHDSDFVIAADTWTYEQIGFYLRPVAPRLRIFDAGRSRTLGEVFAYQNTSSWLVVGDPTSEFAQWACRFPTLLASPLQGFRLHYCPSAYYFLTDRSTAPEQRALLASFAAGPALSFGPGDDILLGDGWSAAEPDGDHFARWAVGRQSFIALPAHAGSAAIAIDILGPSEGPQTMIVNINNVPVGALTVSGARNRYTVFGQLREGINIIRFDFDHTVVPAEVDPHSSDRRQLAARFFGLSVGPGFSPASPHLLRVDEGETYLDETSVWRTRGGRDLPSGFDRDKLARLIGRMGLDPERAIGALSSHRVTLADLATTIAGDSVCADDAHFLRSLFRALFGREIFPSEMDALSRELRRGRRRSEIAWRLGNSDQVRQQVLR